MQEISVHDKIFYPFLSEEEIYKAVKNVAQEVYEKFTDDVPIFVGVLNGVVMFISDFLKHYPGDCELAFVQMQSYQGTSSTGEVKKLMDLPSHLVENRHIVIMEDIVDTGNTLEALYQMLENKNVKSLSIAALLFKPEAYQKELKVDFIGLSIPDKFVVGYGLDYNGLGRNLPSIYQVKE
ncbi:Hypoxanthine-guanine phosphoribosyltransferase [Candidatus Ornithobacterium hominis]|uniref:hypoxanthine phosphoribosyltransferase n=1 Tax=Candidatus Ornithobacterium hominis TaxID=2497989 RepID=UPI000E5C2BF2|nr:hypoxanthine phosphoribosyltransferase [Candidatus Ornithobacterium hominis]SZD73748.1 Hypoxanthine-guanine phosphoribosyltransferase [Candidatus Ornithobacterium hominis]